MMPMGQDITLSARTAVFRRDLSKSRLFASLLFKKRTSKASLWRSPEAEPLALLV